MGIYRQKLSKSSKIDFWSRFEGPGVVKRTRPGNILATNFTIDYQMPCHQETLGFLSLATQPKNLAWLEEDFFPVQVIFVRKTVWTEYLCIIFSFVHTVFVFIPRGGLRNFHWGRFWGCYMTKFASHQALKFFVRRQDDFDERGVVRRVVW